MLGHVGVGTCGYKGHVGVGDMCAGGPVGVGDMWVSGKVGVGYKRVWGTFVCRGLVLWGTCVLCNEVHTSCRQNIVHEKMGGSMVNGFDIKMMVKSSAMKINLKSLKPFRIYQQISTANPSLFHREKAKLAVLIS